MAEKVEYSFVLETAPWPAFLVDASGLIQRANAAAVEVFGPQLQSKGVALATIWTKENGVEPIAFLERVNQTKAITAPLKLRGKLQPSVQFHANVCSVQDRGAYQLFQLFPPAPANGAARPEAKGSSVEINLAQKQKLDCALQLTRTVALDFNNTLTAILGHATHVLSNTQPDHPWRSSLLEIEKAAEHAAEVASQLTAFGADQKEPAVQASGNINVLLRRTVELFQTPQQSAIKWILELEPKIFIVNHDEAKLQQAFLKVLENAVQAIPKQGQIVVRTRNLEISAPTQDRTAQLAPGTYVCVDIIDDGTGIDPAVLPRVFEPFFTTKYGHRGLGLAWVYGIVTNHGGGVSINSVPGQQTSVRIYLPAVKKVVLEKVVKDDALDGKETILFVDDEDMVLTMARTVLKSRGYNVITALSGEEGLKIFKNGKTPIDLLITDMVMPKMTGRELIEKVRAVSPNTRIVCATACIRSIANEKRLDFLTKPFTARQLLRRVREALSGEPSKA